MSEIRFRLLQVKEANGSELPLLATEEGVSSGVATKYQAVTCQASEKDLHEGRFSHRTGRARPDEKVLIIALVVHTGGKHSVLWVTLRRSRCLTEVLQRLFEARLYIVRRAIPPVSCATRSAQGKGPAALVVHHRYLRGRRPSQAILKPLRRPED